MALQQIPLKGQNYSASSPISKETADQQIILKDLEYIKQLGSGGFGQVSLVKLKEVNYNRYMALKRISIGNSISEQKRMRVMRETQILATVDHPQIIKMYNHFLHKETQNSPASDANWFLYILMEYAENGDLLQLIDKHKSEKTFVDEDKIWEICRQVTEGLSHLHQRLIIHRDIKP